MGAWIVCAGGAGADDQYLVAAAGAVVDWVVADGGGIAVLSVLGEIGEERAGRRRESVRRKPSSDLLRIYSLRVVSVEVLRDAKGAPLRMTTCRVETRGV